MYDCLYSETSEWMRVKHNVLIYKLGQIKAQKIDRRLEPKNKYRERTKVANCLHTFHIPLMLI